MHVYTNKEHILLTIGTKYKSFGDWNMFDVLVFEHKDDTVANRPESYEELVDLLSDSKRVYSFYRVDSSDGRLAYDIIKEE